MKNTILVVAAHPDDEVLGCGGTMALHSINGDTVHVLILAQGITSRDNSDSEARLVQLRMAADKANKALRVASLTLMTFPDNRMDSVDRLDITKAIEEHIHRLKPKTVYTHHAGDLNVDHRRTHEAVMTACRPLPGNTVTTVLSFEVASSTEWQSPIPTLAFVPNWFVDISKTLELKKKALFAYQSEMRAWPHARSIKAVEHLAHWRGAIIGVDAAEAFVLNRNIITAYV